MSLAAPFEEGAFEHFVILSDFESGEIVTVKQRARCMYLPTNLLQKLLGHRNIEVTLNTYADVFEAFQTENVEKVDGYLTDLGIEVS